MVYWNKSYQTNVIASSDNIIKKASERKMADLIQFDFNKAFDIVSMNSHTINSNRQIGELSHGLKMSSKAINKEYPQIKLKRDTQLFAVMLVLNQDLFNFFIP